MDIILASIITFVSTNIDDLFILTLFFGDKRNKSSAIHAGQYLGIIALIGVSLVGSLIGNFVDGRYVGLLGLFPIYLGLRQIITLMKTGDTSKQELNQQESNLSATSALSVATVTFANGGDNIGTYVPLFAALTTTDKLVMIGIFMFMTLVWLTTARYLTSHPLLAKAISKYGHIIAPIVLCLLGVYILKENGTFELIITN